jgi:lysozyme
MKVSDAGIEFIKKEEGLKLNAYLDVAGIPTIGYGTTSGVRMGDRITPEKAEEFLRRDLERVESAIMRNVPYGLTPKQFDALASFIYNVGIGAFTRSTLLKKLLASDIVGAANEFPKWNKSKVNSKLRPVDGLTARRNRERKMFLGWD